MHGLRFSIVVAVMVALAPAPASAASPKRTTKQKRTKAASKSRAKKATAKRSSKRATPKKNAARVSKKKRTKLRKTKRVRRQPKSRFARTKRATVEKRNERARNKLKRAKARRATTPRSTTRPQTRVAPPPSGSIQARLIASARRYLGYRYRLGGRGADGTFDCSGLVSRVYADAGLSISRTARAQAKDGRFISLQHARPGDVVYFGSPIHHTGIVLSNDNGVLRMIHASSSQGVIETTVTTSSYWRVRLKGARRVS